MLLTASADYSQQTKPKQESAKSLYATIGGRWKAAANEMIQMTPDELLLAGGLVPSDRTLKIEAFKFTAIGIDQEPLEIPGTGSRFDSKMISVINRLMPGHKVLIGDIKCTAADGSTRWLSPLSVLIKKYR